MLKSGVIRKKSCQQPIKLSQFTKEELDVVLKTIKSWKAIGLDNIPPKLWNMKKIRWHTTSIMQHCL